MVRRPNLFKYLPIGFRIFNCWDAVVKTLENDSINLIDWFSKNLMKANRINFRLLPLVIKQIDTIYLLI
jgi:hypothetical protein